MRNGLVKKFITSSLLFCTVFSMLFTSLAIVPQPAQAQVTVLADTQRTAKEVILDILGAVVRNALNAVLGKLAYDSAVYIASGDKGQDSLAFNQSPKDYWNDVADSAGGAVIEGIANGTGLDAAGLCDLGDFNIALTLGLDVDEKKPYTPACKFSEFKDNISELFDDPKFTDYVQLQFDSTANPLGVSLEVQDLVLAAKDEAKEEAKLQRLKGDFKDKTETISGIITTPGSTIENSFNLSQENASRTFDTVGKPFTDAMNIFASTLVSRLMKRVQQGLVNTSSPGELSGLLSGSAGSAGGRKAAEARFASLKQPTFAATGAFDIIAELSACPENEDERTVNNCALGQTMQLALTEKWTVQELVDHLDENGSSGFRFADNTLTVADIQGDAGITPRAITILKKYRVVPVGWQIASEYIQNSTTDETPSLQELVNDSYELCGANVEDGGTGYSPFCKLVDPNWVLKAPENFCTREAPGPDFAVDPQFIDSDGSSATQDEVLINRLNYCADSRACIEERQENVCTAYGYCTEESRIYRFDGDSCSEDYASCQTFTTEDDEEVSYLKNTLNYNDCATDPGCNWYCNSTDAAGEYNCASSTSTFISCTEDVADNEEDYGLSASSLDYVLNDSCLATIDYSCTVSAGSDRGYDPEPDSIYNYWQCEITENGEICELDSVCGAGSPTYDATTETCTCEYENNCDVDSGASTCTTSDSETISLDDEDDNGSADICSSSYSTYTSNPSCDASGSGYLNCGDSCIVFEGNSSCTNNLGNTCTLSAECTASSSTYSNGECTCELSDSCSVTKGTNSCTSESGNTCILGEIAEDPQVANDTLYFDSNVEECSSSDAGCHKYIRSLPNTNLIPNAYFDFYDEAQNTINDTTKDFVAFCTHDGSGCATDAGCIEDVDGDGVYPEDLDGDGEIDEAVGECVGWLQNDLDTYVLDSEYFSTVTPELSTNYIQIPADSVGATGTLQMDVDTGHDLYNRTFTFSYHAMSLEADTADCNFSFAIGDANGNETATITSFINEEDETIDEYSSDWRDYYYTYTFPDESSYGGSGESGSVVKLTIAEHSACSINIDGAYLMETDEYTDTYANYDTNNITYLNADTLSCEPEDVSCELYVELGEDDEDGIPGIITNPESAACLNTDGTYNYGNPECSQCNGNPEEEQEDDHYVGCGFYEEISLNNTIPLTSDESYLTTEQRDGVMQRYGGRCSDDNAEHCFEDTDCSGSGSGAYCDLQLSVIPTTAEQCGVAQVGCEEYTNLDSVSQGGEGLEYYTYLKQCVKTNDPDINTYYTFEGSDDGGLQIQEYLLKIDDTTGGPCTTLDLSSEDFNAACAEPDSDSDGVPDSDCGPDGDDVYGEDSDCRQFIDDAGDVYYRYESEVVEASDACVPLRSSLDVRVYYALPDSSVACTVDYVGCREYRGTNAGNERNIINENFASNSTDDWSGATSTSNESTLEGDYSLQLHNDDTTDLDNDEISNNLFEENDDGTVDGYLSAGSSYVLTFWAKVDQTDATDDTVVAWIDAPSTDYYFTTSGYVTNSAASGAVTLDPNDESGWQYYQLGPVIIDDEEDVDQNTVQFKLQFTSSAGDEEAYIDTIQLEESNSQYLIQDTYEYCQGFEGCLQYDDRNGDEHYLKSFTRLCDDNAVGCEALIDTYNSTHPFTEAYNLENEYNEDDVIVRADEPITLVYDADNECSSADNGCTEFGLPDVDERTGEISDFAATYLLDRPDDYGSILCEQPQLQCSTYTSEYDGTVYFKNPGDRLCVLEEYTDESGNAVNGWFKNGSDASLPDCPVQYDYADDSQPLGGICNSNSIKIGSFACTDSGGNSVSVINQYDCVSAGYTWDNTQVSNKVANMCNQDGDCYPSGWTSGDPTPRCISNIEDDVDVYDGGYHQFEQYPDDGVNISGYCENMYGHPMPTGEFACELSLVYYGPVISATDIGWVGQCPSAQSGCTEYIDPYSPNIEEHTNNWSFENDVRDIDNVYYDNEAIPDGFPDYWDVYQNVTPVDTGEVDSDGNSIYEDTEIDLEGDGTIDFSSTCTDDPSVVIKTGSEAYTGTAVSPADGASALMLDACMVEGRRFVTIERDQLYTVRAMVKVGSSSAAENAEFSIGLKYYDEDGEELTTSSGDVTIEQIYVVADHATIGSDSYEASTDDTNSVWYQWQGNIGLGSTVEFPKWAVYARPFVANHSELYPVYFDTVSFKKNDKYYYIDYTVDGTSEREQLDGTNTCFDQDLDQFAITSDGGCVAFRDTTYDTQNYSQDALDCTNCLLTPNSDSCRDVIDACDTNAVLQVKKDRVCSEWLGCLTASVVTDDDGNESVQCFEISRCTELDEDGNCSGWVPKAYYDDLTGNTDLHYTSAPGDTDELGAFQNLTGYVRAGVTWNATRSCESGEHSGDSCDEDSDCYGDDETVDGYDSYVCGDAVRTEGFYPYGWFIEIGSDGAKDNKDLIELGTFEQLYCAGDLADKTLPCITNATSDSTGHCYSQALQNRVDTEEDLEFSDVMYVDGGDGTGDDWDSSLTTKAFCPNSPNFGDFWPFGGTSTTDFTEDGWQSINDSDVFVTQFDSRIQTDELNCESSDCAGIDVNNVLEFSANTDGEPFGGGVSYDLNDNITPYGDYALSFDGRFVDSYVADGDDVSNPTTMTICLDHAGIRNSDGDDLDRQDCFVRGYGAADVVFIIDSSSTMDDEPYCLGDLGSSTSGECSSNGGTWQATGAPIALVQQAVPQVAEQLASSGIDVQFALVDEEATQTLELDLTSDTNVFASVLSSTIVAAGANINGYTALIQAINNAFDNTGTHASSGLSPGQTSISYRSYAQPFIVLVTDVGYDGSYAGTPFYTEGDAVSAAQDAGIPIIVVTDSNSVVSYDSIAEATGGAVNADLTDPDWISDNDSVVATITNTIRDQIDIFQPDNVMRSYTFGPIEATERSTSDTEADSDTSSSVNTLLQFTVSDGSAVQIDNVSLLPVLEVSKEVDPISRTCRAYPATDARSCSYSETNGTVYKGWNGYCIERDPARRDRCLTWFPLDNLAGETSIVTRTPSGYSGPSGVYSCLVSRGLQTPGFCETTTWGSTTTFDSVTGADFGEGVVCVPDDSYDSLDSATCGGDECFIGSTYTIDDGSENNDDYSASFIEDPLTDSTTDINGDGQFNDPYQYAGGYWARPNRWQTYDPDPDLSYDDGLIMRIPANEIWRNIPVTQIASILFNTGNAGDTGGFDEEYPYWGQNGFGYAGGVDSDNNDSASESPYDATSSFGDYNPKTSEDGDPTDFGNWLLTDFETGSIRQDSDGNYTPWNNCGYWKGDGDHPYGVGCRLWGLYDSDFTKGWYEDQTEEDIINGDHGLDIVYTWVWSNFNNNYDSGDGLTESCNDTNNSNWPLYKAKTLAENEKLWFASPCIDKGVKALIGTDTAPGVDAGDSGNPYGSKTEFNDDIEEKTGRARNPWRNLGDVCSGLRDTSDSDGGFYPVDSEAVREDIEICNFNDSQLADVNMFTDVGDSEDWAGGNSVGGSNVFSLYLDVNDEGYVQAIYVLMYSGAAQTGDTVSFPGELGGQELTYANMMHLDITVGESCALVSESVDQNGDNVAWANRASGNSDFQLLFDTDEYAYTENSSDVGRDPYASISSFEAGETPNMWDAVLKESDTSDENRYKYASYGNQPVMSYIVDGSEVNAGIPQTCIGQCDTRYCVGNPQKVGVDCSNNAECESDDGNNNIDGVCTGVGIPDISGEALSDSMNDYEEQLQTASVNAQSRLKHVFADMMGFYIIDSSNSSGAYDVATNPTDYWQADLEDSDTNIFDNMTACNGDGTERPDEMGEDGEYCGVYPTVENISMDGNTTISDGFYDIDNGRTVRLTFDTSVEEDQKPLDYIYIDWGDGGTEIWDPWEAEPTTHIYTHAYNCGPEYPSLDADSDDTTCEYQPKITVVDHWWWCSGTQSDGDGTGLTQHRHSGNESHINADAVCGSYDSPSFLVRVDAST